MNFVETISAEKKLNVARSTNVRHVILKKCILFLAPTLFDNDNS